MEKKERTSKQREQKCTNTGNDGVAWLSAMARGLIPGWGTKILQHAAWPKKLNKHKKYLNYFPESVQYDVIFQVFPTPRQGKNV